MAGAAEIAKRANITEEQVKTVFTAISALTKEVGKKVTIMGFGGFKTVIKNARVGRNPQTGETLAIPAKTVLTFKPATPKKPQK